MTEHLHRHDVWGDDPEERDASEVVEELLAEPGMARKWHDHPTVVWTKAVGRFIAANGQRIAVTIAGFAVLLAGVALLVLPGPGWLLIFVGLGILSHRVRVGAPPARHGETEGRAGQERRDASGRTGAPSDVRLDATASPRPRPTTPPERRLAWPPASILIGTSSWTDPTLVKEGQLLSARRRRAPRPGSSSTRHASRSSRSTRRTTSRRARRTPCCGSSARPPDFTFNIKAYSLLTNHPTRTESLYKDLAAELPEEMLAKRRIYRDKLPDEVVARGLAAVP